MTRPTAYRRPGPTRIAWFADLETIADRPDLPTLLATLRDEIGLTTVVPESHLSHTSGFRASPAVAGPLEDWASRPELRRHRTGFGVAEQAFAVLPGVVGGFDDAPLLRLIEACRVLGLEVWGHAGLWCYGGEVFPELAARDLFDRELPEETLPWGTMFCPSKAALNDWIGRSLADAAGRYDLDGWFMDHARYTSPGHGPSLLACGCADCAAAGAERGVDLGRCRDALLALRDDLAAVGPERLAALADAGPVGIGGFLGARDGVLEWFLFRARLLADRFAAVGAAIRAASPRSVEYGSDVFPPSVALLGGHCYPAWAESATYLTGGFGPRIGWGSVAGVTATNLAPWLQGLVPGLERTAAERIVGALLGLTPDEVAVERDGATVPALLRELHRIGAARLTLPVYPPVPAGFDADGLRTVCRGIVEAGLHGGMFAGLEAFTAEQRRAVRTELTLRLP